MHTNMTLCVCHFDFWITTIPNCYRLLESLNLVEELACSEQYHNQEDLVCGTNLQGFLHPPKPKHVYNKPYNPIIPKHK
jgi:hypothetical protein